MIDLKNIKLIIWDLDETLWSGTLSEGSISLPQENIKLIIDLTECGIINSICSKNDFNQVKKSLQEFGIWDYFVFPTINWESKGPQLKDKLEKMALRPNNSLFIDDNKSNIGEAEHYIPGIQVAGPEVISTLLDQVGLLEKKDKNHKRLQQYKILEKKDEASRSFSSSEDFLFASQIQVSISHDCINQIQRIHELLLRSNQLNYTKKRISIEELKSILVSPEYDCGYVTVTDKYGDYGLVGFYAIKGKTLEHFFFSCRTMGQKIEQWVYAQLGYPHLTVSGEVRTVLNETECPRWINNGVIAPEKNRSEKDSGVIKGSFLLKGPCDLSHSQVYIKKSDCFDTEFSYISSPKGQVIDAYNHSVHIEGLITYSDKDKKDIIKECIFVDPSMLEGSFFKKRYDIIFLSTLIESSRLIYKRNDSGIKVVFGNSDLTNPRNWDKFANNELYTGGNAFTTDYLRVFSSKYVCIGTTTPEMYLTFLDRCLERLPRETSICLILGAVDTYEKDDPIKDYHRKLNGAILSYAKQQPRIKCLEIDNCVHDQSDFVDGINHFSTRVYYEIAQKMILIIKEVTGKRVSAYSSYLVLTDSIIIKIREFLKRIIRPDSIVYKLMKGVYNRVYKERS